MPGTVAEQQQFECDRCESTTLAKNVTELVQMHSWLHKHGTTDGRKWRLLLCEECKPK
jgi:hypothetical protein